MSETLTVEQALQRALAHYRAGEVAEAAAIYQAIVQVAPFHPVAQRNLQILWHNEALKKEPDQVFRVLRRWREEGWRPRALLDIGANLGEFTQKFVALFPECRPTLIEPNPHCLPVLRETGYRVLPVAASRLNGTAELYLTKEWPQSTGASLYRENTSFFRDEVVTTTTITTARLDDLLPDEVFDFIKIDVQGSELDVLTGGECLVGKAGFVLIEVSLVEYNRGSSLPEFLIDKLEALGFAWSRPVQFHRMDETLTQIDFLFKKAGL
ncbi:MAG: FkbM family methyltransferase [Magnetococcales bacterium]|nr:FkbM family methyltransferase [Magnetococcales bacterium]